ncbi:MAG TPA: hypothetical protein PKD54_04330 [Pirellulaceae bacterium]|nr:hypothetical protein [Pirellulaceae bacterium]
MEYVPVTTPESDVELIRDANGRFIPGTRPPPGKAGRVGGRAKALLMLDRILSEEKVQARIGDALREAVMADPMKFFRQIIMPLLPTEVKMKLGEEGAITWLSLSTTRRIQGNNPSTTPAIDVSVSSVAEDVGERPSASPPSS